MRIATRERSRRGRCNREPWRLQRISAKRASKTESMSAMKVVLLLLALAALVFATTAAAMTKSQAKAIIRDVNLKASDMPGYRSQASDPPTAADGRANARLARCYGGT